MDVPPHPHTGLQTVSWLFSGEVEHRDSAGVHAMVRPGELNLMTAGAGICHSEVSTAGDHRPARRAAVGRAARRPTATPTATSPITCPTPRSIGGATLRVFLGELVGDRSPVHTFTPLLGAQLDLDPGARGDARRRPVLRARRAARPGQRRGRGHGARRRRPGVPGRRAATVSSCVNRGDGPARVVLLGGPPFAEQLVMWWNFVGRSHDDIAAVPADVAGPRRPLRRGRRLPRSGRHACPPRRCQTRRCGRGPIPGYRGRMTTDKTGAPTHRHRRSPTASPSPSTDRRSASPSSPIATASASSPTPRCSTNSSGRGLATILVDEALQETRDAGLRIVAVCPMVAAFVKKHDEFDDVVDPVNSDVKRWLANS